ncbi:hypothetical protein [Bifidobacterium vespertilionis]|uniref:DUF5648 domain-containing protein n=1 Tax=Bifidobacterium vespertilionis TaxID=2562524 RepID=A0A5J5DWG6_9BIFI|nr:hypothetical protein [Bifidobacterium vespertilionis]KAA8821176.1 hypothetical protein EMO90_05180 [Bifidobacterium vespertilionis]KAA8821208.1 hypothetical protein EM848_11355 [Bifidobacterium vespertilionis]
MISRRPAARCAALLLAMGLGLAGATPASADTPADNTPSPVAAASCQAALAFTPAEQEALSGLALGVLDESDPSKQPVTITGWNVEKTGYVLAKPALVVPLLPESASATLMLSVTWTDKTGGKLDPDADGPIWLANTVKTAVTVTGRASKATRVYTVARDASLLPAGPGPAACRIPVYRLFNPYMTQGTTHLFTTDKTEYGELAAKGWRGEDVVFYALPAGAADSIPVYRLYNRWDGSHHFTTDPGERDDLVKIGWTLEPSTWAAPRDGDTRVYRLYNPYTGEHLFTTDRAESDRLAALGWTAEESGFSVYSRA